MFSIMKIIAIPRTGNQSDVCLEPLNFGLAESPFGSMLLAWEPRGICFLCLGDSEESLIEQLLEQCSCEAIDLALHRDDDYAVSVSDVIFSSPAEGNDLTVVLAGTSFQLQVWQALEKTKLGQTLSYRELATLAGSPKAQRAVGSAMAANPVAYLIPCHRVIRGNGELGQYRWGSERKAAIQLWESARRAKS